MKIRSLTLAVIVSAGIITTQVFGTGSAHALDSRPGMGVLKSQDAGATWHYVGSANGGVWKTTDGAPASDRNTYYVGSANGGVWK